MEHYHGFDYISHCGQNWAKRAFISEILAQERGTCEFNVCVLVEEKEAHCGDRAPPALRPASHNEGSHWPLCIVFSMEAEQEGGSVSISLHAAARYTNHSQGSAPARLRRVLTAGGVDRKAYSVWVKPPSLLTGLSNAAWTAD